MPRVLGGPRGWAVSYLLSDEPSRVNVDPRLETCIMRFWRGLMQAEASI